MIRVILIFILSMFCYHLATKKYLNPYKLIMIFGKKGSGKTTLLTKIAITELKRGHKVYSTIEIPGTYVFNVEDVGLRTFEPESVVLIDEVGMIWDNRDYRNFKPRVRDFFKFQRQYRLKVYLFSQTFDIDLKLRNLTDEMYLLTNFARVFSIQRRIIKRITINNASENSGGVSQLVDEYKFDSPLFGGIKVTFIPRWVVYFKSYDPKKLAVIDGKYYDMNELQKKYLSTKNYFLDQIKIILLKILHKMKKFKPIGRSIRYVKVHFKKSR